MPKKRISVFSIYFCADMFSISGEVTLQGVPMMGSLLDFPHQCVMLESLIFELPRHYECLLGILVGSLLE